MQSYPESPDRNYRVDFEKKLPVRLFDVIYGRAVKSRSSGSPLLNSGVSNILLGRRTYNAGAFTLVELLTVIVIIGILGAILIPTMATVRKVARGATCVSNLRQIAIAMQNHVAEHKTLPIPDEDLAPWYNNYWMSKLQPYLEKRTATSTDTLSQKAINYDGVFRCPGKPEWDISQTNGPIMVSYGMNIFNASDSSAKKIARRMEQFQMPGLTMLVMDRATRDPATGEWGKSGAGTYIINSDYIYKNRLGQWHQGEKDNVLFLDGHVESLPLNGLNYYLMKTKDQHLKPL